MNKRGFTYIEWLLIIAIVMIIISCVAVPVYIYSQYGDTPVSELPFWIWWLMR